LALEVLAFDAGEESRGLLLLFLEVWGVLGFGTGERILGFLPLPLLALGLKSLVVEESLGLPPLSFWAFFWLGLSPLSFLYLYFSQGCEVCLSSYISEAGTISQADIPTARILT
jgi:hypothetical protein